MREMTLEESKKAELFILRDVAAFCDKKGYQYFLAYGTLLGAVRHKGFIPWDDDIDIFMPRSDYNKMILTFNEEAGSSYRLISPFDPISRHSYVKVIDVNTVKIEQGIDYKNGNLGVDIDIFPLDGQPQDDAQFRKWYKKLRRLYFAYTMFVKKEAKTFKGKIGRIVVKLIFGSKNRVLRLAEKLHQKYPYENCETIGSAECLYTPIKTRYQKEWFEKTMEGKFEEDSFSIPAEYDKVLTATYGDYMTPPPKEQQITHHTNKSYFL